MKKTTNLLIIFAIYLVSLSTSFAKEKVLFAGVTRTNITPTSKDLLQNKIVHDSLYAKTIILDNQINKIAFIIVDSQGIAQFVIDEAKKQIHKLTNFPIENIIIASTHTHSGIIANISAENFNNDKLTDYQNFLISKLSESIVNTTKNLQPAKIAWSKINKPEHVFNRRWYTKELNVNPLGGVDSVKMNPGSALRNQLIKPAGPTDPQINFIAITKLDKTPLAILANYSLHYIGDVKPNELSADYYGTFDIAINKLLNDNVLNPNFVGIMSNGTSGDINNHDYSKILPSYPYYQKMENVAQDIAQDIAKEYKKLDFKTWIPIELEYLDIIVYPRETDTQLDSNIKSIVNNKSASTVFHPEEKYFSARVGYYKESYSKPFLVPLQAISLGDLAISTIPFEVFVETGLELKKRNPFKDSFTIGLANGHWGYLPTPEQHKKGGYETWITVNRVEKNTSRVFTERLLEMFKKLKSK